MIRLLAMVLLINFLTGCLVTGYGDRVYPANPEEAQFAKTVYQTQVVISNPYVAQKYYNTGVTLQQQYVNKKLKDKNIILPQQ